MVCADCVKNLCVFSWKISWKFWEIKMQSKRLWLKRDKYCCLKVYCFTFVFRIRQISHKFNFSLIWSNLLSDCFFRQRLPPFASKLQSRNKLKSSANIIGLFLVRSRFSNKFVSSKKVVSWSFTVLALYK